jgi:hypothetical protein
MRNDLEKSDKKITSQLRGGFGTKARLDYALKRFDIRVKPFLELVLDITIQDAFVTWIGACEEMAWREYQGHPPWVLQPLNVGEGSDAWIINTKTNEWITRSYRWLDSLQRQAAADMTSRVESVPSRPSETARAFEEFIHETRLNEMRESAKRNPPQSAPVTERRKKAPSEPAGLTHRASWTRARLRERAFHGRPWDHNTPQGFGGPDRKTMKRILAGLPVHEGTIEKLLTALNKKEVGRPIELSDVPSD